jgi:hypothetical protein
LIKFVIGLENNFSIEIGNQAFKFHAHSSRISPTPAVFGFQDDHRVFAVHDDIASTNILSDFHKNEVKVGRALDGERGGMVLSHTDDDNRFCQSRKTEF